MELYCLRCKTPLADDYHLIFDETGIELQLDKLLADYFQINVEEDPSLTQALCEWCVNKLIEKYDLTEKNQKCAEETEENIEGAEKKPKDVKKNSDNPSDAEAETASDIEEVFRGIDEESDNTLQFENVQYLDELEDVNTQEYVRGVIKTELEEVTFDRNTVCKICNEVTKSHTGLLMHTATSHESEAKTYPCIICETTNDFNSIKDLAMHVVLKHYDLDMLNIYCICPECGKRFSNLIEYNKHSCYKTTVGSRLTRDCAACLRNFCSNKRYRFHLQFHLDKRRPKACLICDILFADENEMFEHLMYAHGNQDSLVCKKCDRICTTKELFDNHAKLHDAVRSYQCQYCDRSYLYKQMLDNHTKRHHLQKNENKCPICDRSMASKHLLNRHMQLLHYEATEAVVYVCPNCGLVGTSAEDTEDHITDTSCTEGNIVMQPLKTAFACEFCELAFNTVERLKTHRAGHTNKLYKCWICQSDYTEFKKLKTHLITHTKQESLQEMFPIDRHYVCDYESCEQSYRTWPSLRAHKARHVMETKYTCEVCAQAFTTRSQLNTHVKSHENNEEYHCQFCAKICCSQMSLAVHIARKHNTNSKTCHMCKATYSTDEALKDHIEVNHVELKCKHCGKQTKNKRNLDIHVRMIHKQVKRYFCKICDKGYYNRSDFKVHEKTHSEEHKFQCQHCDFSTSYEVSLNAHTLKHESKKPFKCEECSKEFTRSSCFKLHILRHSEIKPFSCSVEGCERKFVSQGILNSHLRDNHPDCVPAEFMAKRRGPSRSLKRKKSVVEEATPAESPMKYMIVEVSSDVPPNEVEYVEKESEIVFVATGKPHAIVLEYDGEDSDVIEDLNQAEFSEFTTDE